jgi:hypothetical protein
MLSLNGLTRRSGTSGTAPPSPCGAGIPFTGEDVAALLDPGDWKVITDEAPQRSAPDPDGRAVMIRETVFQARCGG